ncbi:unnamed protein product [Gemmata massiliana]|uniref:Uncharacterized protein n=1 Tax=Gemmata massiliana TaxID=1210884 RepID=A0A6P2CQE3_9BACT|nr:unnamed protein product [Gemmata massiliana]
MKCVRREYGKADTMRNIISPQTIINKAITTNFRYQPDPEMLANVSRAPCEPLRD